jgi:MFS family permease
MYFLTEQPTMVGLVSLTGALPMLILSPFGGVIADGLQKKQIMAAGQVAFAAVSLGIALAIELEVISPAYLIVASLFHGSVMGLMMPARQSIISEIVGAERVTNAVSLNMAGQNINRLTAPALAGFLIEQMGIAWVYFTIAALNVLGALLAVALRYTSVPTSRHGGAWRDLKDGILYIRRNITVLHVLVFCTGVNGALHALHVLAAGLHRGGFARRCPESRISLERFRGGRRDWLAPGGVPWKQQSREAASSEHAGVEPFADRVLRLSLVWTFTPPDGCRRVWARRTDGVEQHAGTELFE